MLWRFPLFIAPSVGHKTNIKKVAGNRNLCFQHPYNYIRTHIMQVGEPTKRKLENGYCRPLRCQQPCIASSHIQSRFGNIPVMRLSHRILRHYSLFGIGCWIGTVGKVAGKNSQNGCWHQLSRVGQANNSKLISIRNINTGNRLCYIVYRLITEHKSTDKTSNPKVSL